MKRTTVKLNRPNALFEKWLQEWKDEAANRNSDLQHVFGKALTSLRKYPLPLRSGRECLILENFGTRICLQLDRKLAEHKKLFPEENGICETEGKNGDVSPKPKKTRKKNINQTEVEVEECKETKEKNQYIPAWRSAPYAILIALYNKSLKSDTSDEMNKEELIKAAQSFTDTSMYKPLPNSFYTGWSSMSQLVKKELVCRRGNPPKFTLTTEGLSLAKQLPQFDLDCSINTTQPPASHPSSSLSSHISPNKLVPRRPAVSPKVKRGRNKKLPELPPNLSPVIPSVEINPASEHNPVTCNNRVPDKQMDRCSQTSSHSQAETFIFLPGTFQVILLVDTQETHKGDEMVKEIRANGTLVEVRRLKVGDFVWICRNSSNQELVLPYIIERKRLDDLASSIKDGRFHEQKFRLKQCGIPNCIYLVERHGEHHYSLPLTTLLQAATNTQVIDNFTVKFTSGHRESVIYLSSLSSLLTNIFTNKTVISCEKKELPEFNIQGDCVSLMTFSDFSRTSGKFRIFRIQEMFVRHLLQLRGLSVEKALKIVEKYPTPRHLIEAYRNGGDEKMLAGITTGASHRPIGIAISKAVHQLYTNLTLK